jgi:large subunit ribosomal protein L16
MLQPKRTLYRKQQKGRIRGLETRGHEIAFGSFGLKALEVGRITSRQIEACRIAISRTMKRKGKGAPEYWVAPVRPGKVMFELDGVSRQVAEEALNLAAQKLPIKCKIVVHREYVG